MVPILASTLWGWPFYTMILMTYTYTEGSYKVDYPQVSHTIRCKYAYPRVLALGSRSNWPGPQFCWGWLSPIW